MRLSNLQRAGYRVWVVMEPPAHPGGKRYKAHQILARIHPHLCRIEFATRATYGSQIPFTPQWFEHWTDAKPFVIDPAPFCFDAEGVAISVANGRLCYLDDNHLSPVGAEHLLRPLFEPLFEEMAQEYGTVGATETPETEVLYTKLRARRSPMPAAQSEGIIAQ